MNEMKKVYEITVMMCGEESTLIVTNPRVVGSKKGMLNTLGLKSLK